MIRKPWTRQPPPVTPIDLSNPITKGLLFFAPIDEYGRDAVSGEVPTAVGPNGQIRLEQNAGNLGSGWCFDTTGSTESGDAEGWYWGTGLKNGTFPVEFYNRGDGATGWTTMTWARRESDTVAWQLYFGVVRDGPNCYQGCIAATDECVGRMEDSTGSDSATLGVDTFTLRTSGVDHWVLTMSNTGSATTFILYKNTAVVETITTGVGRSVELDAISTNACGIVANTYAANADPLDGITMSNAIWNRVLSAAEIQSLYKNPWQIFKPKEIFIGKPDDRRVVVF